MKGIGFVFSHAHWDIEWYMPFRSYRFWLVELLDGLPAIARENPGFRTFVLDGQVAPLEHYLAVRPEAEQAIRALVAAGKLAIGPFYTQFDEWLVSPESIVRNCLFGRRRAAEFGAGNGMRAGYLPDNFGHPAQLPQILAGFGIDSLVFMRGMPDRPPGFGDEFLLQGLDGTRVIAIHLSDAYINAAGIGSSPRLPRSVYQQGPYGDWMFGYQFLQEQSVVDDVQAGAERLVKLAREGADRHPSGVIPLANGHDHAPPQARIGEAIERANGMQNDFQFVQGSVGELVDRVRPSAEKLPVYRGELWGARYQVLLTGTLSTRTYIKQNNFASEALLEKYADPLAAYASLFGAAFPATLMEEAWKLLFVNHAHDGIHGSSADPVHAEMMQRFLAARQIAGGICNASLERLGASLSAPAGFSGIPLVAYNPVQQDGHSSIMEAWVDAGAGPVSVVDHTGTPVPAQALDSDPPAEKPDGRSTTLPWPSPDARHVIFAAHVPGFGVEGFFVVPGSSSAEHFPANDEQIENNFFIVQLRNGALDIQDKATAAWYRGIGVLEEEADAGDAWDYSPTAQPTDLFQSPAFDPRCHCVESGPVRSSLQIDCEMQVPECLQGQTRSARLVPLPVSIRVSLMHGAPRIELLINVNNTARDHRIRLRCPTGIASQTVTSQGHFGILERPAAGMETGEGWQQPPSRTHHFREWVAMEGEDRGLAMACRGLYEYESQPAQDGVDLLVTLLRGIGCMGRCNLPTRLSPASPAVPTPDAQCLGPQHFEIALIPLSGAREARRSFLSRAAAGFLYPPIVHVIERRREPMPDALGQAHGRAHASPESAGLPLPIVTLAPAHAQVSGFKRADDGKGFILRIWENEGRPAEAEIELSPVFTRAWQANLAEEPGGEILLRSGKLYVRMRPYGITTLRLE
ncbi:MAG: glycoside hydrolase family 38 C-terminal domain-containing protein [Spirochaetia bacterium]|jgi:hypothetical protein